MKIKNLYVVDGIVPLDLTGTEKSQIEMSLLEQDCICEKVEHDQIIYYRNLENNNKFYQTSKLGIERTNNNPIPLSEYFYFLGIKKFNKHKNQKKVYAKVKSLKRKGIL